VADTAKSRRDIGSIAEVRTPPHSVEAEQAVLGSLLLDTSAWDQVADMIRTKDFYRPDHRLIFDAIGTLATNGKP
jgi:replicative DNA helicase